MQTKFCRHCNKEFPKTTEFFYANKNPKSNDGLRPYCKPCQAHVNKNKRNTKPDKPPTLTKSQLKLARKMKINLFRAEISRKIPKHLEKPVGLIINNTETYWSNEDWLNPFYINWNDLYLPLEQWDIDYWKLKNEIEDKKLANTDVPKDWREDARINTYLQKD